MTIISTDKCGQLQLSGNNSTPNVDVKVINNMCGCGCGCDSGNGSGSNGSGSGSGSGSGYGGGISTGDPGNGSGTLWPPNTDPTAPAPMPPSGSGTDHAPNPDGKDTLYNFTCDTHKVLTLDYGSDGTAFNMTDITDAIKTQAHTIIPVDQKLVSAQLYVQAWSAEGLNATLFGSPLLPTPRVLSITDTNNNKVVVPSKKKGLSGGLPGVPLGVTLQGDFYDGQVDIQMDGSNTVRLDGELKSVQGFLKSNPATRNDPAWCIVCLKSAVARPNDTALVNLKYSYVQDWQNNKVSEKLYDDGGPTASKPHWFEPFSGSWDVRLEGSTPPRGQYIASGNDILWSVIPELANNNLSGVFNFELIFQDWMDNASSGTFEFQLNRAYTKTGHVGIIRDTPRRFSFATIHNGTIPYTSGMNEHKQKGSMVIEPLADTDFDAGSLTWELWLDVSSVSVVYYWYHHSLSFTLSPYV